MTRTVRIVGAGRAGRSLARAIRTVGWGEVDLLARDADVAEAAAGVDLVVIATPDAAIAPVAAAIRPADAVVLHLAGSRPLTDLAPHRAASLHPLASLPDAETGARRLLHHGRFAVAGDPVARELAEAFGGTWFEVPDDRRALYHATAAVAANHVVAVLAQVERLADEVGVPAEAFLAMSADVVANATERGAIASLTGPASRGDTATLRAHLEALPSAERELYRALAAEAARLADRPFDV